MASEYEKMIAGDYYRPADLNYGLWQKPLGRNKRPLTKRWILKRGHPSSKSGLDQPVKTSILIARFL